MAIRNVLIHVADLDRSVRFYTDMLGGEVIDRTGADRVVLDFVTATIELVRVDDAPPPTWEDDDQVLGFRHIGFKVAAVDPLVARIKASGVEFRLDPLDATGGVRIAFFFDPDGTVLEIVEGMITYHEVVDEAGVATERAMGTPDRPRFDHVGVTIRDLAATADDYGRLGFANIGTLHLEDPRGFRIDYLKGGDSVIEVFTFEAGVRSVPPRIDALGFVAIGLDDGGEPPGQPIGTIDGGPVFADANDLTFTTGR